MVRWLRTNVAPTVVRLILSASVIAAFAAIFFIVAPDRLAYLTVTFSPDLVIQQWIGEKPRVMEAVLDRLLILALVTFWIWAARGAGRLLLSTLGATNPADRILGEVISISAGLHVFSLFVLGAGIVGWLRSPALFWTTGSLFGLIDFMRSRRSKVHRERQTSNRSSQRSIGQIVGQGIFIFLVILYAFGGALPPWDFDVREYHLQAPKEFFERGSIGFVPHNVYANMPLGAEAHTLAMMVMWPGPDRVWWGALCGKTLISLFAPLTALAIFDVIRRRLGESMGWLGAITYVTVPWVAHVSLHGLVDGVLAHYTFLAAITSWRAIQSKRAADWVIVGCLAGAACSVKYTGVVLVAIPVFFLCAAQLVRSPCRQTFVCLVSMIVAMSLSAGPWFAKNFWNTGNPTYPLGASVFGASGRSQRQIEQWRTAHSVPVDAAGQRYGVKNAWNASWQVTFTTPWGSPTLIPLAVLGMAHALFRGKGFRSSCSEVRLAFGWMIWIFSVWYLATHRLDRFWLPAIPFLVWIAGFVFPERADQSSDGRPQWDLQTWIAKLATGFACAYGLLVMTSHVVAGPNVLALADNRFLSSLREMRTEAHSDTPMSGRIKDAHRWLNRNSSNDSVTLVVGDADVFDLEIPILYNTCFDLDWIETLSSGNELSTLKGKLIERRISHIYVHWGELTRYRSPGNYGYSDFPTRELFVQLVSCGVLSPPIAGDGENWEIFPVAK